ncbi:DUF1924 domain-containing protein [Thiohalobacter sp. IOR34]|uniref:DUF1924 domain-containing protein n=1 Tax=Thiohalobacter sp. IOR34 TaxID=3057176 RepID=UPI0025B11C60|nr:DUF1924 domain-containing protein [Thiohalobacter sp. IOR34]WJW74301.1 DUF1924 domain-containing protein [Thiohalobacter sp. IOR34]
MMQKPIRTTRAGVLAALLLASLLPGTGRADAVGELLDAYRAQGAAAFSASRGETLWMQRQVDAGSGTPRSCTSCHSRDLRSKGRHARTGKLIEPMAPSVNPQRLTDRRKIEKWFRRNCKWTLGRLCTPQEKGDILSYLSRL